MENSISDETYADLQNVKKNKAKIFDLEQLLQKIEIESYILHLLYTLLSNTLDKKQI